METSKRTLSEVLSFTIPTIIITYAMGFYAFLRGGLAHFPAAQLSMLVPALVTIVLYLKWKKLIFKGNELGLRFANWKFWFIVPVNIFLLVGITYGVSFFINPHIFLSYHDILSNISRASISLGNNPLVNLGLILILNIFLAPVINFPFFLGEELGWRGFLTPRLLKIMKPVGAFILSGIIWGIWHFFGIIMGQNYPGYPVLGNFLMILFCIPMGVIFQFYYVRSGSIFIPMIAHGAVNWTATTFMVFFVNQNAINTIYHGPTGILGIAIFWLVGYYYYRRFNEMIRNKDV